VIGGFGASMGSPEGRGSVPQGYGTVPAALAVSFLLSNALRRPTSDADRVAEIYFGGKAKQEMQNALLNGLNNLH
jgi:hypothetical protein